MEKEKICDKNELYKINQNFSHWLESKKKGLLPEDGLIHNALSGPEVRSKSGPYKMHEFLNSLIEDSKFSFEPLNDILQTPSKFNKPEFLLLSGIFSIIEII